MLIFWISPLVKSGIMSTQNIIPGSVENIGLRNYQRLFKDRLLFLALGNSVKYTIWTLIILIPVPLLLAVLINSKIGSDKFKSTFKSILFIPALTSVVVAGIIFRLIFSESPTALMNQVVGFLGFDPIKWLKGSETGFMALLTVATWRWTGVNILYFLAGLQAIPNDYYEAAALDGAKLLRQYVSITLPQTREMIFVVMVLTVSGSFTVFAEPYILTGGGPGNASQVLATYMYRVGFFQNEMGYASALATLIFVITLVLSVAQATLFRTGKE